MFFSKAALVVLSMKAAMARGHTHSDEQWAALPTTIPVPISDMTATPLQIGGNDVIIVAGGCSSSNGNEWFGDGEFPGFYCTAYSNHVFAFYPTTGLFVKLADMPQAKYRHAAVAVDGKLYVIGGRGTIGDNSDALIPDVDVYDPDLDQWTNFLRLDAVHQTSDHGAFVRDGHIYVVGGYEADYAAKSSFYELNIETKVIEDLPVMQTGRGDLQAVYYNQNGIDAAYAIGGFTDANGFCTPLGVVEMFDFKKNEWTTVDSLSTERGDKAAVVLNGRVLAIGGEDKHEDMCKEDASVDPASQSQAVGDIESFDPRKGDEEEWQYEIDLPEIRFRGAAAPYESSVFFFGGQKAHDIECNCYRTADDVFQFTDTDHSSAVKTVAFSIAPLLVSLVIGVLML